MSWDQIIMLAHRKILISLQKLTVALLGLWMLAAALPATAATCANPCVTKLDNGNSADPTRTFNIVYVSQGFSAGDIENYRTIVGSSSAIFSPANNIVPFNKYSSYINLYRVDQYGDLNEGLTAEAMAALPNISRIIYVQNRSGRGSAGIPGDIVLTISSNDSLTTAHEMGHALGGLVDEYAETALCPGGVYTGTEPGYVNVTINTDLSTLKWNQWLGVQGTGLIPGGRFCSSGIYHPVNALMTALTYNYAGDHYGIYGPVNNEELLYQINKAVNPIVSQTPSQPVHVVTDTQQIMQLSAEIDSGFRPQGVAPVIQWLRWDDPLNNPGAPAHSIAGATSNTLALDLSSIPLGGTIIVRMVVIDPDVNAYNRRYSPLRLGLPEQDRLGSILGAWQFSRATPPAPVITSIDYSSPVVGGGVQLYGENLCNLLCSTPYNDETWVSVGGGPFTKVAIATATGVAFYIPQGSFPGTITVQIRDPATGQVLVQSTSTQTVNAAPPSVTRFWPSSAKIGDGATIEGNNFCPFNNCSQITVAINGVPTTPFYKSNTFLSFTVPIGAVTGPLTVTTAGVTASGDTFTVLNPPVITSLWPDSANPGDSVVVQGRNFCNGTNNCKGTSLNLGGFLFAPSWLSEGILIFKVPAGAANGPFTIRTLSGTSQPRTFTVPAPLPPVYPSIISVMPSSAKVGDPIVVQGTKFCGGVTTPGVCALTSLAINDLPFAPMWITDSLLTFRVPAGAVSGPLRIITGAGPATTSFTVTP